MKDDIEQEIVSQGGLSVADGLSALAGLPMRVIVDEHKTPWPEIYFRGVWVTLCRTDFWDDVCTGLCAEKTADEWRAHYLKKLRQAYGVRLHPNSHPSDSVFAVVDAMTDG